MSIPLWEMILSLFIIIMTLFFVIRKISYYRVGKKIWKAYREIAENSDLNLTSSIALLSNWPNLFGSKKDRKLYVHPDKGSRKVEGKTVFGAQTDIDTEGDIIIVEAGDPGPEDTEELRIPVLNNFNYDIYSNGHMNKSEVEKLFSKSIVGKIDDLVDKNREDFRALILEPGLMMFSTFKITIDKDKAMENISLLSEIAEHMEDNIASDSDKLNLDFENSRLARLSKGSKADTIKTGAVIVAFAVSAFFIYRVVQDFSFIQLNIGVAAALMGISVTVTSLLPIKRYQ